MYFQFILLILLSLCLFMYLFIFHSFFRYFFFYIIFISLFVIFLHYLTFFFFCVRFSSSIIIPCLMPVYMSDTIVAISLNPRLSKVMRAFPPQFQRLFIGEVAG